MKLGLTSQELREIRVILRKYPAINEVVIFGSRATGKYKKASDVDLALKGRNSKSVGIDVVAKVKYLLEEETLMPYFFDVVDYARVTNDELKAQIDQFGKRIYKKSRIKL